MSMGTPHSMTQHLNLLNREPGLNCFTLPGNQGALHFSTGWRRRGRINQAWNTSLPSRCTQSPVSKDGMDMKSINIYLFAAAGLVFLVWPDSSVFWLHVKGLWTKSALMYKNFSDSNSLYLKTSVSKVRKGTLYNCQSQLEVDNSWMGFSFCQAKVWKSRTAIWIFRGAGESHSIQSWVTADVSIGNIHNPWVISFSILFFSLALPPIIWLELTFGGAGSVILETGLGNKLSDRAEL